MESELDFGGFCVCVRRVVDGIGISLEIYAPHNADEREFLD